MSVKSKNAQYDVLVSNVKYDLDKLADLRAFYEKHNEGAVLRELSALNPCFALTRRLEGPVAWIQCGY